MCAMCRREDGAVTDSPLETGAVARAGGLYVIQMICGIYHSQIVNNQENDHFGHLFPPRCAQRVVRFSMMANSSYIAIAMAPMTTRPAKASGIFIDEPADTSR